MKEILEKEKLEERRCMVVQMKPSWVRVLGQGNKFSFAKPRRSNKESEETEPSSERNTQGSGGGRTNKSSTEALPIEHREEREVPVEETPDIGRSKSERFKFDRTAEKESRYVLDENWEEAYLASDRWKEWWDHTQDPKTEDWPEGVKIFDKKFTGKINSVYQKDLRACDKSTPCRDRTY